MVILDTCAIIEACKEEPGFSAKTVKQIETGFYLLSISFAEIACKVKLKKLEMSISPKKLYELYCEIENVNVIDIGAEEWFESIDLDWNANKDPVDRLIVAFAKKRNFSIVSSDQKMKKFYKKVVW